MNLSALKSKSLLLGMLGIVILVVGIVAVIMLMPESQDTRRQAAVPGGTARVRISPAEMELSPGETETATVSFSPEGSDIIGVTVRLRFPMDPDEASFSADDVTIASSISSNFTCPTKKVTENTSDVVIDVACTTTGGTFTAASFVEMFSFDIIALDEPTSSPVTIAFDAAQTIITQPPVGSAPPADIAAIPSGTLLVSVEEAVQLTKTTDLSYDVSCESDQVTAKAVLKEGGEEKGDISVEFRYNNVETDAISNSSGLAEARLPKAGEDIDLTVQPSDGYPSKTTTVILPTGCSTGATTTPTPTPTATPISGTTGNICNTSCEVNRDCQTGLSCVNGLCRSANCPADQTCRCASTDPTTGTGDTQLPESGFDQTVVMTILGIIFILGGAGLFVTFAPAKRE